MKLRIHLPIGPRRASWSYSDLTIHIQGTKRWNESVSRKNEREMNSRRYLEPTQGAKNLTNEFFPLLNSSKFALVSSAAPEALATEAQASAAKSERIAVFMVCLIICCNLAIYVCWILA